MQPIRWGVMSTANIGRAAVIPAIRQAHNSELIAVASRSQAAADDFAAAQAIPQALGSYAALLASPEIDAVYIPLPNNLHKEWSIKAADAGKHVLCEKPLALSAAECDEMAAAAAANGVLLMEAFMYRFHPRMERVLTLVEQGVIGTPRVFQGAFTFRLTQADNIRFQAELGGGALMDVGCYCVNAARTIAGREPTRVQATAAWNATGVDNRLAATLYFGEDSGEDSDGEFTAQFDCALTMARREAFLVAGDDGFLTVDDAFLPGTRDVTIGEHHGRDNVVTHTIDGVDEYQLMIEHFADCIIHQRPPRYGPAEAAANLRVIEALYRSARNNGRPELIIG